MLGFPEEGREGDSKSIKGNNAWKISKFNENKPLHFQEPKQTLLSKKL